MRTDQAFVLLLILLLPLTGCIDTIGEVDAQADSDSNQTSPSNQPEYQVIWLDGGTTMDLTVNNSIIQIIDVTYSMSSGELRTGNVAQLTVDCGETFTGNVRVEAEDFVPTIPGQDCVITFQHWQETSNSFVIIEHPASRV